MKQRQLIAWILILIIAGGGLLAYLLRTTPPYHEDGQLNGPMIALFFAGLLTLTTGLASTVALLLHRRWPALGGARRFTPPHADFALRQGFFFACAIVGNTLLAFFQMFDIVFVLALPLLAGLCEAYLQHRQSG
jgi:hypothetical protein